MLKSGVIFQNMTTYCMVSFCGKTMTMTITRTVNTTKDFFLSQNVDCSWLENQAPDLNPNEHVLLA